MSVYLFVGPYLEFLTPENDPHECPKELWGVWQKLRNNNSSVFRWNVGRGSERVVRVGRRRLSQQCAVPVSKRRNPPRVMYWEIGKALVYSGDGLTFDYLEIDREAEIKWFQEAYAEEFETLVRVFGMRPTSRWGLVTWKY
jgi:hypothetical protein